MFDNAEGTTNYSCQTSKTNQRIFIGSSPQELPSRWFSDYISACWTVILSFVHRKTYVYIYIFTPPYRDLKQHNYILFKDTYIYIYIHTYAFTERSLEVKLPTIWTDEKQRWEESEKVREEKRSEAKRREEKRKSQKEEDPGGRKGRKVTKHCVFPTICGSGWVRSQLARWGMKNCTPLWREAHFQVKSVKNWPVRTTLGSWDDEKLHAVVARSTCPSQKCKSWGVRITLGSWDNPKVHAVVARSTFRSQNVQSTSASDRFWKLRCRKSAYRCGAKHVMPGPLFDFQMSFRVAGARDCAPCQKWANREGFGAFPKMMGGSAKMHFPWQAQCKRHIHQSC